MDITKINIHSLPSLPIQERKKLPNSKGLYFVLSFNEIVYVGMTVNFQQRLFSHHKIQHFTNLKNSRVAWLQTPDSENLSELEEKAISFFNPKLNGKVKMIENSNANFSVKLPSDLRDKAREKSERTGISLSFVVRKALEDWVDEEKETQNKSK